MTRTTVLFGAAAVLAACLGATLARRQDPPAPHASTRQDDQKPIDQGKVLPLEPVRAPRTTGETAMTHARAITGFGPRHSSAAAPTPGWTQQLDYLVRELKQAGLEPERDTWTDRRERITFTNVRAVIRGKRPERIVLAAHHDTKCTQGHADPEHNFPFVGANDGASGCALLLALAPTLLQRANEATIELVFFDGEESLDWDWNAGERAMFGSKRYVQRHRDAELTGGTPRIAAMVLLDMVGRRELHIQEELFSTPRLRAIAWSAAKRCGHEARFFRAAESASDDHRPFLDVGIPSIDLIDLKDNPYWHTADDTIETLAPESLQCVADVVLTMLPAIEREYVLQPR